MNCSQSGLPSSKRITRLTWAGLGDALEHLSFAAVVFGSTAGFFGEASWFLDLFSHFRVQYLGLSSVIAVVFWLRRKRTLAGMSAVLAAVNAWVISAALAPANPGDAGPGTASSNPGTFASLAGADSGPTAQTNRSTLRTVTLNVHTENRSFAEVRDFLNQSGADFVGLQEVDERWLAALDALRGTFPHWIARPRDDNFGIAFLSRHPISTQEVMHLGDAEIPSILARIRVNGRELAILTTHPLPPGGREYSLLRNEQLAAAGRLMRDQVGARIVLGDLNTTPWNTHFRQLLDVGQLEDSSRGFGWQPTWPAKIWPLRIPLDHFLHSKEVSVLARKIGPDVGSDHNPLVVDFLLH